MSERSAETIHEKSIIIDAHSDILIPVADGLCRLSGQQRIPSPTEWLGLPGFHAPVRPTPYQLSDYATWFGCAGQYGIEGFRQARLTAQVVAIYVADPFLNRPVERAMSLISALHREIAVNWQDLSLVRTAADIELAKSSGRTGLILAFEGAEPLGHNLDLLEAYHALGLRIIGLTHSRRNLWADGTQMATVTGGLTQLGRSLVKRVDELGIVIDLAHLNDVGFWEVLELASRPLIVSHTSIVQHYVGYREPWTARSTSKGTAKLKALAEQGGVVGILFWGHSTSDDVADDIFEALSHVGDDHVGLGSDLFSRERSPAELDEIGKLPNLTETLLRRGLSEDTLLKILGLNWLRVFQSVMG